MSRHRTRAVAGLMTIALASAACGLQPTAANSLAAAGVGQAAAGGVSGSGAATNGGVSQFGATGATGATGASRSATATSGSFGAGTSGSFGSTGTGGAGATFGTGTGSGTSSTGPNTGTGSGTSGGAQPSYERVGITATTINIGIHAPETGAAPIPLQAFATGAKLFWENHTIFGHHVVMNFMNDQYNPSVARQVCEQLSRSNFLVIGGAGTDQIQACATDPVLAKSHTPYLSAGVTTNGLTGLFNYFAISQSYAAQSPGVYTMATGLFPKAAAGKWAIVTENTPNFNDATSSMAAVLAAHHVHYTIIRTPKYYSEQDAISAVNQAHQYGATTVYLDVDPNFWIDMVGAAQQQVYAPAWVGPGITNGENLVAGPVCGEQPQVSAAFLSPFPGLDRQPAGFAGENNPPPDTPASERDIEMLIYGFSEIVYRAMLSVGSIANLTRDNFIAAMPHFAANYNASAPTNVSAGPLTVSPNLNFNGGHFGGTGSWELELSCTAQEYVTKGLLYQ